MMIGEILKELESMGAEIDEIFKNHDVGSVVDWLEKLDKRVSDIEENIKNELRK